MPQSHDYTAVPQPDEEPRTNSARVSTSDTPTCAIICAVAVSLIWLAFLLVSPRPFYAVLFTFVAILPAYLVALFVLRRFKDHAVSKSFLFSQFILGAVPLSFAVLIVETIIGLVIALTLFSSDMKKIKKLMAASVPSAQTHFNRNDLFQTIHTFNASSTDDKSASDLLAQQVMEMLPLWKLLLMSILTAFVVAALTEELGKWLIARRYKLVNELEPNVDNARSISCKGILSVACMGALGFATAEHALFSMGMSLAPSSGFPLAQLTTLTFRALLAFPIHVGTQCYIAVATAQTFLFREPSRVLSALFLAVVFHGTFDATPFVLSLLYLKLGIPSWTMLLVPPVQVSLAVLLLVLCRGRYKALLEKEQMLSTSDAAV
ncbi:hypothetical protein BWQ96_08226 [Gracilariopsis chorda]|uniref:Uncharacterized protein n=1 Tax=Gracilariopsis chorda TaxID=448386 RepID=A0A2V3IJ32_9FLOR|nr:hypothetical protein BWQ96_08226 [Gracilariopsis chorda]|eukprot:PXF42058.1 hypothetical protein BWQ96_08226 [Gracilariopsis chorda]